MGHSLLCNTFTTPAPLRQQQPPQWLSSDLRSYLGRMRFSYTLRKYKNTFYSISATTAITCAKAWI